MWVSDNLEKCLWWFFNFLILKLIQTFGSISWEKEQGEKQTSV